MKTGVIVVTRRQGTSRGFGRRLLAKPLALASLVFLTLLVAGCVLSLFWLPYDPLAQNLTQMLQLPSAAHWLGTDALGRDVLSRLLAGGLTTLVAVLQALVVAAIVGPALGLIAGFFGGWADRLVGGLTSVLLAMPMLVILLAVTSVFLDSTLAAMIALGVIGSAPIARVVRGATLTVRDEEYAQAAAAAGVPRLVVVVRHILPRLTGPIVVQLALFASMALAVQGALAFLGLGVRSPAPSWGGGIAEAQQVIFQTQWLFVPYGGVLALTILAFGLLGDASRDAWAEVWSADPGTGRARRHPRVRRVAVVDRIAPVAAVSETGGVDEPLLRVDGLTVEFDGAAAPAVAGVSLSANRGEIVGIVGESGSGKSTVMLAIASLLPSNASITDGVASLHGAPLLGLDVAALRRMRGRRLAYISQDPMSALDPSRTVGRTMAEIVRRHGVRSGVRERSLALLESVRIPDPAGVLGKYPFELSGGMAQRVCIALALVGDPDVLIADEPTTALDVTVQAAILDLLRQLAAVDGRTVLLVTHNLGVVADVCERVLVMRRGVVVEEGTVVQVLTAPAHEYTQELLAATPTLGTEADLTVRLSAVAAAESDAAEAPGAAEAATAGRGVRA